MFDRAWIENELTGLMAQQYRIEGMISVLEQMRSQLDEAERSASIPTLTVEELQALLSPEHQIVGEAEPHENPIHP